ncbi:MAG TPA: hypothetical protein VF604_19195 [Pyrinomonadaceae bacterium]|jgi:hypothetical protein
MKATDAKSSTLEKIINRRSLSVGNNPFTGIPKDLPGGFLLIDFNRK